MRTRTLGLLLILASCAASLALASRAEAQDTFTIESTPASGGQIVNKLTWATSPAGATCTASGDWTGGKAGSGSETLPAATPPLNYGLRCEWLGSVVSATLTWIAPTTNTDGTPLAKCATATDTGPCLAKYKICRGATAAALTDCRDHNFPTSTTSIWSALTPGTHWFGVQAVAGNGAPSIMSNTVSKTITAPKIYTASVGVKVPNPPTNVIAE